MNTAVRCALIVLLESAGASCGMCVFCLLITFLFGVITYTEACLRDIESLFCEVNRLAEQGDYELTEGTPLKSFLRRKCEGLMLERCKEAVNLHIRLNRCVLVSTPPLPPLINISYPRCLYDLASIMNTILMVTIAPFTVCVCCSTLIVEKVLHTHSYTTQRPMKYYLKKNSIFDQLSSTREMRSFMTYKWRSSHPPPSSLYCSFSSTWAKYCIQR